LEDLSRKDIAKMSKEEKIEYLEKESPEFFPLISDFGDKLKELNGKWIPLMQTYDIDFIFFSNIIH
jgi:hypothetical protein